jgi:prepilin-type N-terminal cleavage/methylation domain-containing protein/prepilin-type processing-associated H-X9-DG protein
MRRTSRQAFTLIELLCVIAIIAVLMGLLLPSIQRVREAASRMKCQNNLKQLALACLNFESTHGGLPRGGEHNLIWNGQFKKTQDYQSLWVMTLPYIEQDNLYRAYNLAYRYNATQNNIACASVVIQTLLCPSNQLAGERNNGRDSLGLGCSDYVATINTTIAPDGTPNAGDGFLMPGALSGSAYPAAYYADVNGDSTTSPSKRVQLVYAVDPFYGLPKIAAVGDGTSNTWMLGECAGTSEVNRNSSGGYADPITGTSQLTWPAFSPDQSAAGIAKRINNTDGNRQTHDCFNNSELWQKGHNGLVNVAYVDGSVRAVRESLSTIIVRAAVTRDGGEVYSLE